MTVVINYVSDYLSIILTDRRISYGLNGEFGFSDDAVKLIDLKDMGWASGAGLSFYLDNLKKQLSESEIKSINDVMEVYKSVTELTLEEEPAYKSYIENSVVSFSFNNFDFENLKFRFHIGLLSKELVNSEGIAAVLPNYIQIIYPSDIRNNDELLSELKDKYERYYQFEVLEELIYQLLIIFDNVADNSRFVSKECDMGFFMQLQDGIYKMKLSGNVHDLIQSYHNGEILNNLEIINAIK
jgi:hypothetical protein